MVCLHTLLASCLHWQQKSEDLHENWTRNGLFLPCYPSVRVTNSNLQQDCPYNWIFRLVAPEYRVTLQIVNALAIEIAPHCRVLVLVVPPTKATGVAAPFPATVPVVTVPALRAPVFPAQVCTPHLLKTPPKWQKNYNKCRSQRCHLLWSKGTWRGVTFTNDVSRNQRSVR